jgi:hypothetical protein
MGRLYYREDFPALLRTKQLPEESLLARGDGHPGGVEPQFSYKGAWLLRFLQRTLLMKLFLFMSRQATNISSSTLPTPTDIVGQIVHNDLTIMGNSDDLVSKLYVAVGRCSQC